MAKLTKLDSFVRGDTPLLTFNFSENGNALDLSGYAAKITITSNQSPTSLADAVIKKAPMTITGNTASYQVNATESRKFAPDTTYYGDVELTKSPEEINTLTPIRFQFKVLQDFGV